jgi:RHS family protein
VNQDPIKLLGGEHLYVFAPNAQVWIDELGLVPKSSRIKGHNAECVAQKIFQFDKNTKFRPKSVAHPKKKYHIPDGVNDKFNIEVKNVDHLAMSPQIETFLKLDKPLLLLIKKGATMDSRILNHPNIKIDYIDFDHEIEKEAKRQGKCGLTQKLKNCR